MKLFLYLFFLYGSSAADSGVIPIENMEMEVFSEEALEQAGKAQTFWKETNAKILKTRLKIEPNKSVAKNIILFIGDGMSLSTVTAARLVNRKRTGESTLSFEKFPQRGLAQAYCVDTTVADSACTATAYWAGARTNIGLIGVTGEVTKNNCHLITNETSLDSMAYWSQLAGKSTGIVTNTRVTHASPAGGYAKIANRHMESDNDVIKAKKDPKECIDIATQLVKDSPGKNFNVVLGGGRVNFRPKRYKGNDTTAGKRMDKEDLIEFWLNDKKQRNSTAQYVWNRTGLLDQSASKAEYVLGLFSDNHMHYNGTNDEPTLTEMTKAAITNLQNNENGFMLFVEGGLIDIAHHNTRARIAIEETIEFSRAIQQAYDMTNPDETLIVVSSDHSHTMTIAGYSHRGTDIFKFGGISNINGNPYTVLSYANGPNTNIDNLKENKIGKEFQYPATFPMSSETHAGDDVGVFATGPWSHLFTGSLEQTFIPFGMMYAACIGPNENACSQEHD